MQTLLMEILNFGLSCGSYSFREYLLSQFCLIEIYVASNFAKMENYHRLAADPRSILEEL